MKLYQDLAKEFSNSRAYPWKGWEIVMNEIDKKKKLNILDLGCGNARFLEFLIANGVEVGNYYGIDNSEELLSISKQKFSNENFKFINVDLEGKWKNQIDIKFDVIVVFGVMHHIKDIDRRILLLIDARELLLDNGFIASTYWQFGNYNRFLGKATDLGNNDYLLPFGKAENARFCHFCNEEEVEKIEESSKVRLLKSYYEDGSDHKLNLYRFYK